MASRRYRVRVLYREPTYELQEGVARLPYSSSFDVSADTIPAACEYALREFRKFEALSSVGWVRDVVRVQVEPVA